MKAYIELVFLCVLLGSLGGCSLMKTRNRLATSASSEENTSLRESTLNQQIIVMKRAVLDSSETAYTVVIYPADAFHFSLQDGFKGSATKVEVSGFVRQKRLEQDSTNIMNVDATAREEAYAVKMKSIFSKGDKVVERTTFNWRTLIILGLGLVGFCGWVYWKAWRTK